MNPTADELSNGMLVQRFLREGGTLTELNERYGIDAKFHSAYPELVMLKYSQIDSPMGEPIVQECRGVILDSSRDWKVISRPFDKFFNYGEGHAKPIHWESAKVQRKLDGSLVTLYYYDRAEGWLVASSGMPDAAGEVNGCGFTFNKLFWDTWAKMGFKLPDDPFIMGGTEQGAWSFRAYCFMFELMTPYNRVVVPHKDCTLKLIGVRRRNGYEMEPEAWADIYPVVESYPLKSVADMEATFKDLDPLHNEGYVVCDHNFNRIKVKHPGYVAIHNLKDGFGPRRVLEIIRTGEKTEFTTYFPEWKPLFDAVTAEYEKLVKHLEDEYERLKGIAVQKEFALEAVKTRYSSALFSLRNGKTPTVKRFLADINIKSLMECLALKDIVLATAQAA